MTIGFVVWLLDLVWLIIIIAIIAILLGSGFFFLAILTKFEQLREQRAKRREQDAKAERAEKDSMLTVIQSGDQIYYADELHRDWNAAHLDMRFYRNSRETYQEPSRLEIAAYQTLHQPRKQIVDSTAKLLPDATDSERVQTFYELLDIYPHLMLIAPSGSGKSTQISLAANYLLQQKPKSKLIWMSTHALEDKQLIHPKAVIIQLVDDIVSRLNEIVRIYCNRRDNDKKNYTQLIVVVDEWYDLIMSDGDAKAAIKQLASGARKFGIILILASQTENVKDTGISKEDRRNFGRVRLDANLTKQGKAIWMKYDKQDSWQEIELPKRREMAKQLIDNGAVDSKNQAAILVYGRNYGGDLVSKF